MWRSTYKRLWLVADGTMRKVDLQTVAEHVASAPLAFLRQIYSQALKLVLFVTTSLAILDLIHLAADANG